MSKALIGKKVGMTQVFNEDGTVVPVTVLQVGPCVVTDLKTEEKNGYNAVQLGFDKQMKANKINKPMAGVFKKNGVDPYKVLKEFKVENVEEYSLGQELSASVFAEGDVIDVQGTSKGKGFQGVVKRHGFAGGPKTHGSHFHRATGAVGMCEFPGETPRGKKMPGRQGGKKVSIQRLNVVKVIPETNVILVKGAIPGHRDGIVYIKETVKSK